MRKPFAPFLTCCLAVAVACPLAMHADEITFDFMANPKNETVTSSSTTLSQVNGGGLGFSVSVADTNTANTYSLPDGTTVEISAIPIGATGYFTNTKGAGYSGYYTGDGTITVTDAVCESVSDPTGICFSGIDNQGLIAGEFPGKESGSFGGSFTPTYISPYITSLFGDPVTTSAELALLNPTGSADGYDALKNTYVNSTNATAEIQSGEINEVDVLNPGQSVLIPEPSSYILFGSGLLFFVGLLFNRRKTSGRSNIISATQAF